MKIKFWGEYGLFTRPEYKAEPHTYSVLTPTAAKGMLESIFWKPEFHYVVHRITVLHPIRVMSMQRNMGQKKQSFKVAKGWMNNDGVGRYFINSDRTQRNHVLLKNPAYVVDFNLDLEPHVTENEPPEKYLAQLKRRIDRGQCYKQPYFGCREYPAFFCWASEQDVPHPELMGEQDLGMMPKALHYVRDSKGSISWRDPATRRFVKGRVVPELFHARMINGVVEVR
ncbi:MAG: type I-C CRISPR-associated protein Cas5c [Chroococcales cyanobacterium]